MFAECFISFVIQVSTLSILGDPGADSGGEGKSKQAENMAKKKKVKNLEKSPWGQCFTRPVPNGAPIRSQNGGDPLELVW